MTPPDKARIEIDWRSPKAEQAAQRALRLPTAMSLGIQDALNMALQDVVTEVLGDEVKMTAEAWEQRAESFAYMLAIMTDFVWSVATAADASLETSKGSPTMLDGFLAHWRERYGPDATDPPAS